MPKHTNDRLQGTLDLVVLKTLASRGPMHGYAMTQHFARISNSVLRVEEGSLYPALHRMMQAGWLKAEWVSRRTDAGLATTTSPPPAAGNSLKKKRTGPR